MRATRLRSLVLGARLVSLWAGAGWAHALRVVGGNGASGEARPDGVEDLIAATQGGDRWGFSEVPDTIWATLCAQAAAQGAPGTFAALLGTTGGGERRLSVDPQARFDLVRHVERRDINLGGNVRAPLVAHCRVKPAGPALLFMVKHLSRTNTEPRHAPARRLNTWARQHTLPVIALGGQRRSGWAKRRHGA